jgi:hypothetical protein
MLTALILVCSLATVSNDCTRDNALDVVYVPATFASLVTCLMHGQAYLADSSIGRDLSPNETVKVICLPGPINRVDKSERRELGTLIRLRHRKDCGANEPKEDEATADAGRKLYEGMVEQRVAAKISPPG